MNEKTKKLINNAEKSAQSIFEAIDETALANTQKVLTAFKNNRISARHFAPTTGYGYDDVGRDALSAVFAEVFNAESALVSPNLLSGTHTLTVALFGLLKTGDTLLCASGAPYDTLLEIIHGENNGSLLDYGIKTDTIDLKNNDFDYDSLAVALQKEPTVVFATRSRGYSWREAFSIETFSKFCRFVKEKSPKSIIFVDNCYGEFVSEVEPTAVGADVIAGSLIKNPCGGLAPTGGYIAGKTAYVNSIANRLTSPSIGAEVGSYAATYRPFYQGLFLAPTIVANALKGSVLLAFSMENLNYEVSPAANLRPNDIIRSVKFNTSEELISFIQSIQYASPVDSYVTPEPWDMPGYEDKVIMAAGTFVQGASIELSADSPIRAPYIAYVQGGLTYEHCKIAIAEAIDRLTAAN